MLNTSKVVIKRANKRIIRREPYNFSDGIVSSENKLYLSEGKLFSDRPINLDNFSLSTY